MATEENYTDSSGRRLDLQVGRKFHEALLRISNQAAALEMWRKLFRDEDRALFDNRLESNWPKLGTYRMWMLAKNIEVPELAVINLAEQLNLLSPRDASWLREEMGLKNEPAAPASEEDEPTPIWDADRGELRLGTEVIRKLRVLQRPTNIQKLVEAFASRNWPPRIANPLSLGQQQLHETLRYLNKGLTRIRFRSQQGAKYVTWEIC